jgi:hypothetical protein
VKESPLELERGHVGGSEPSNLAGVAPNDQVLTRARLQLPRSRPVREEKALHAGYFARDDAAFWVALSILSKKNHFGTGQSVRELHSSSNVDSTSNA